MKSISEIPSEEDLFAVEILHCMKQGKHNQLEIDGRFGSIGAQPYDGSNGLIDDLINKDNLIAVTEERNIHGGVVVRGNSPLELVAKSIIALVATPNNPYGRQEKAVGPTESTPNNKKRKILSSSIGPKAKSVQTYASTPAPSKRSTSAAVLAAASSSDDANAAALVSPAPKASIKPFGSPGNSSPRECEVAFTLFDPSDHGRINLKHIVFRRSVWEGFVVSPSSIRPEDNFTKAGRRANGHLKLYDGCVGFRCRFCKGKLTHERAPMSTVFPTKLSTIYRAYLRFRYKHFFVCELIPKELRNTIGELEENKVSKGEKKCWEMSAELQGLGELDGKKGIVYNPVHY
mmetsp:Transcript_16722/g.34066  ORF Transcript_16722/g.34066 Transcript_16722/m.34066 type:complete len:346 (+) Transcript_16722:345-1382(+)